jgi:hypothetical protein
MLARTFRSRAAAALATLVMAACASTASPRAEADLASSRLTSLTPTSRSFDAERIRRSGATTAWDAVRLLVPRYRLEAARNSLSMLSTPRRNGYELPIRLILDGHPIMDLEPLRAVPAQDLISIHVLSATEAATYFAGEGGRPAIVVQTRYSLHPR